jgi:hypothetical protein
MWPFKQNKEPKQRLFMEVWKRTSITLFGNDGSKTETILYKKEFYEGSYFFHQTTHWIKDGTLQYWNMDVLVVLPLSNYKAIHISENEGWQECYSFTTPVNVATVTSHDIAMRSIQ